MEIHETKLRNKAYDQLLGKESVTEELGNRMFNYTLVIIAILIGLFFY